MAKHQGVGHDITIIARCVSIHCIHFVIGISFSKPCAVFIGRNSNLVEKKSFYPLSPSDNTVNFVIECYLDFRYILVYVVI